MNIKEAKNYIKDSVTIYLKKDEEGEYRIPIVRQRPIFLLGAPGIGKTAVMEQIAQELGIALVSYSMTHHTRQSALGLPFITHKEYDGKAYDVSEYTMSEIIASVYDVMAESGIREGILFLDEINCVSETLAPSMLQFLQYKSFGNHKIPAGWIIVAAGNPPEYNKSVREFDMVTMDRVKKIEVEADFGVWKEYAYQQGLHGAVISYLNARKQHFYQMETTVDGRNFATPRGWEDLSNFIRVYEKLGKEVDREVVAQYIQFPKIAKDFANYLELYYKYQADYQLEEIFQGHLDEILIQKVAHASFDERLSVLGLILSKVNEALKQAVSEEWQMERLQSCLMEFKALAAPLPGEMPMGNNEGVPGEGGIEVRGASGEVRIESGEGVQGDKGAGSGDAQEVFGGICQKMSAAYEQKKKAELLGREEDAQYRRLLQTMERFAQTLKLEGIAQRGQAFRRVKELFAVENGIYERRQEEASHALEYAFDFLEGAFGSGQEMVMFITELNSNYHSVKFLQGCDCPRYFQYNQELLFDEKRRKLLERLS